MELKHEDILQKLSLKEKCYLLSGRDFWSTYSVQKKGVPSINLSDGPHGIRKQEGAGDQLGLNGSLPATCFPTAATIANSWDPKLGEQIGDYAAVCTGLNGLEAAVHDLTEWNAGNKA